MEQLNALYDLLKESAELYENALILEYEKYDAAAKDDIEKLNNIISKEQVFYLKVKGVEQKREKLVLSLNMQDKTLKEIIEIVDDINKEKLTSIYKRLYMALTDFKKINNECKTIIEVRLHRIDNVMAKLGQKQNTYTGDSKHKNLTGHIMSKNI